jgi:hypothetical protein
MKRLLAAILLPASLGVASFSALAVVAASPVGAAAAQDHAMVHAKTWHGKVTKINETMGTTESFSMKVGATTYVVHYDALTKFEMGSKKNIKVGAQVSVTGTLKSMTISATKLSA